MNNPHPLPNVNGYKLIRELGNNKNVRVYQAWQIALDRPVTLKILRYNDKELFNKFTNEINILAHINHYGIRPVYETGQTVDGYSYLVMEYIDYSLRELLIRQKQQQTTYNISTTVKLLMPIAEALDTIHKKGIVHLNVKPENILINKHGQAMLADFGIAQKSGTYSRTGTPLYMSPEQLSGDHFIGAWSDIYAFGVVIYEMLTGALPFTGVDKIATAHYFTSSPKSLHKPNATITRKQEQIILSALNNQPSTRPKTAT